MSKHTFTPSDTVVHDATGERGTLISTNGYSAVVEWDTTGGKNPADILPVTDLEPFAEFTPGDRVSDHGNGRLGVVADDAALSAKYPGYFPVQWDNGTRTVAAPSILAPVAPGIESVPTAELETEAIKRGSSKLVDLVLRRINEAVDGSQMNLATLSRNTGIPATTLRAKLAGHSPIRMSHYWSICHALGLDIAETARPETTK